MDQNITSCHETCDSCTASAIYLFVACILLLTLHLVAQCKFYELQVKYRALEQQFVARVNASVVSV